MHAFRTRKRVRGSLPSPACQSHCAYRLPANILLVRCLGNGGADHHLALALAVPKHEELAPDLADEIMRVCLDYAYRRSNDNPALAAFLHTVSEAI